MPEDEVALAGADLHGPGRGGVTVDDCALISHQLGDLLDVHDGLPARTPWRSPRRGWIGRSLGTRIF